MDEKDYKFLVGLSVLGTLGNSEKIRAELYQDKQRGDIVVYYTARYPGETVWRRFTWIKNKKITSSLYAEEINKILDGDESANRLILDVLCCEIMDYEGTYLCYDTPKLDREKRFNQYERDQCY